MSAHMMHIDSKVKSYILRRLLMQISKISSISFYKSRQIFKPDICDHDEIDIQIKKLQNLLKSDIENIDDPE